MTNIQEIVERSIFKVINDVFIANGYSVNFQDNPAYLDPYTGKAAIEADLQSIEQNKGFVVKQYGPGNSFDKDVKKIPRIVIEPEMILPGDVSNDSFTAYYEKDPRDANKLIKYKTPYDTTDINIDIHLVYRSAKQSRILHGLLSDAIGTRAYIERYDLQNQRFFIFQYNFYNLVNSENGIEEKVYSYTVKDLYLTSDKIVDNNISPIKQIETNVQLVDINNGNLKAIKYNEKFIIPL